MAYKKFRKFKKRYRRKKRNYVTKRMDDRRTGKLNMLVNKRSLGIPDRYFTKLAITAVQAQSTGTLTQFYYQLNSLYDPYHSYFGTQPMFHDQL